MSGTRPSGGAAEESKNGANTQILQALEIVHHPRSSNALRQDASKYLERVRSDEEAPFHGFGLASAKDQPAIVRHFGLSLLDYAVRHRWSEYSSEQSQTLRDWVLSLAYATSEQDPPYITNKVAALWVEIAKRSWALDWMDMDELLVRLWEGTVAHKTLVLTILEALSEEVFGNEDPVAGLRGSDLNRACVDVFTPAIVLSDWFPTRDSSLNIRYGSDGWLSRMSDMLDSCINEGKVHEEKQALTVKVLSAFKSVVGWVIPRALVATKSVHRVCACLAVPQMSIQLAAMDSLYSLYNRTRFLEDDFRDLVGPMFQPQTTALLKQLYEWLIVDATDIDDAKYLLSKKYSEMIYNIGSLLVDKPAFLPEDSDLTGFLDLALSTTKSQSLQVSIPVLHLWVKLLSSEQISNAPAVLALIGDLLETCSHRLLRYESLPEDSNNPSILFLNEDIETMPERHAFLGNYARFCNQVIESVVQKQPIDALYHILGQADHALSHLYDGEPPFQPSTYIKTSDPLLSIDTHFTVIEAALKGCLKWLTSPQKPATEHEHEIMTSNLQVWCDRLLGLIFEDPLIKERVVKLAVGFATGPLKRDARFALRVFDHILDTKCPVYPGCVAYNDAVTDLQNFSVNQLHRLAMKFPDYLVTIFDEVERKVITVGQAIALDEHSRIRYSSVLFVIIQRSTTIDSATREARMEQFLQPFLNQWQGSSLNHSLSSFEGFCDLLGLRDIQQYMSSRAAHTIEDWSLQPLDDEGRGLQVRMQSAAEGLPLRATEHLLSLSMAKLEPGSLAYDMACRIWQKNIAIILPNLLHLIRMSQALHDPSNWPGVTPDLRVTIHRIFTDRFWQVGISQGSRDEFYAKIGGTKQTLEGFASSIRGTVRTIRETGYRLLYCLSLLGDYFYGFQDLSKPLAQALFTDACSLSPRQMSIQIDIMRPIIQNCPENSWSHFLPPILTGLFEQVDRRASSEWERIEARSQAASQDDDLASEMKNESILRQLTMASVSVAVVLLEPPKSDLHHHAEGQPNGYTIDHSAKSMRNFILKTPEVLKPIILFCTHALRMRDTRACGIITKVLQSIVPEFANEDPVETDVREFISTEVLKACITSLNDPYFVELQKDFAQLIACILITYAPRTETPKGVLLSLLGMGPEKVDRAIRHLFKAQSDTRRQRAIILELLQGFRGVAIHEQGKLPRPDQTKLRSVMQQKYVTINVETNMETNVREERSPDLGGVADMFG